MKTVKEIVAALAKEEGVAIVKNVTILDTYVGEVSDETGACNVVITLDKSIPAMVQVTKTMIDELTEEVATIKAKADAETDAEAKALLVEKYKELEATVNSLDIDDWVKDENNRIFISNFDVIGMLRQNPEYQFLTEPVQADESLIKGLLNHATVNVICEDVTEGEEHHKPFTSVENSYVVPNDSVYHTPYNLRLSEYGEDKASEIKDILAEITKERLMSKLRGKTKRNVTRKSYDEDED